MTGAKIIEGLKEALELAREGKTMREPPKRWRNWWRAREYSFDECAHCGAVTTRDAGDTFPNHCKLWPSRDTAQTFAWSLVQSHREGAPEYLGAFPEGERP